MDSVASKILIKIVYFTPAVANNFILIIIQLYFGF